MGLGNKMFFFPNILPWGRHWKSLCWAQVSQLSHNWCNDSISFKLYIPGKVWDDSFKYAYQVNKTARDLTVLPALIQRVLGNQANGAFLHPFLFCSLPSFLLVWSQLIVITTKKGNTSETHLPLLNWNNHSSEKEELHIRAYNGNERGNNRLGEG